MAEDLDGALVLGGSARPIGSAIAFIECPIGDVRAAIDEIRAEATIEVAGPMPFADALRRLDPMQAPWTKEVVADCGRWTAYVNNFVNGGDPSAIAPALAQRLGVACVTAEHTKRYGPGHESTQLWMQGPTGRPPLMGIRSLAAHCADGRWSWHEHGDVQPFEQVERYSARRKRDRLDRPLLVSYLSAMEIDVDGADFFGDAHLISQIVDWPVRSESVATFWSNNGWT